MFGESTYSIISGQFSSICLTVNPKKKKKPQILYELSEKVNLIIMRYLTFNKPKGFRPII